MIIYLSLKQLILNQINVLLRKKAAADPNEDDVTRLNRRLSHLQKALEQIKSYSHNQHFEYVIRHFDIELNEQEQSEMRALSAKFDDLPSNRHAEKSGFTTTRSETLFTGAAEERYDYDLHASDDEKSAASGHANLSLRPPAAHGHGHAPPAAPTWLHYRGFAHWLKKQSFVKFKKRNDHKKYEAIWRTILALKFTDAWARGRISHSNIIGTDSRATHSPCPVLDISKCGSRQIVKAALLRLSVTTNRIFKFDVEPRAAPESARTSSTASASKRSKTRTRGSVDMDEDDEALRAAQARSRGQGQSQSEQSRRSSQPSANEVMLGRDLFDEVTNKDVLRIVATMLWDKGLADNVLQEFMQNPRFSMCGTYGQRLANQLRQEMPGMGSGAGGSGGQEEEKGMSASPGPSSSPNYLHAGNGGQGHGQRGYEYDRASTPTIQEEPDEQPIEQFSLEQGQRAMHGQHGQGHRQEQPLASPSPSPMEKPAGATHKPHSASVVFHDNIRDSQIYDNGVPDEDDSHSGHEYGDGGDEDESESVHQDYHH